MAAYHNDQANGIMPRVVPTYPLSYGALAHQRELVAGRRRSSGTERDARPTGYGFKSGDTPLPARKWEVVPALIPGSRIR